MPYTDILIHYNWTTKSRSPIITKELKPQLLSHIKSNSLTKNIYIDTLNCVSDHIHLLISLSRDQTISEIANLIKGESSHWINKKKLIKTKFSWQDDYIALSVSPSAKIKVQEYILNQEEHHRKQSFAEECERVLNKIGVIVRNI